MEIELTRLFVKVVQQGSFSRAAQVMNMPKSTVSKAITRLENESGTKLLLRTTRSQTLTAAGLAFYETCLGPIQILEDAQKSLHGKDSIISGTIKMTGPEDLGYKVLAPVIAELSRKHPQLSFQLNFTNQVVDLVKDGYDLAVRIGKLGESSLRAKKVGDVILVPVASKKYLNSAEKIRVPKDLENHHCLTIASKGTSGSWQFKGPKGSASIAISAKVESNQVTGLMRMAMEDAGVAFLPLYLCREEIDSGKLIRVLPDWSGTGFPVSIVSPLASSSSARMKVVSEALATALTEALKPT